MEAIAGVTHVHTRQRRRRAKSVAILASAALALVGIGVAWEQIAEARARSIPPPGTFITVAGHEMHLHCTGTGTPTVVFESGVSDNFSIWSRVQPLVTQITRACSYDRAGLGWSDPGDRPRDTNRIVTELQGLLHGAGERPPYVLVGHSLGGVHSLVYASRRRSDIAGIVLVDPTPVQAYLHPAADWAPLLTSDLRMRVATARFNAMLAYAGIPRTIRLFEDPGAASADFQRLDPSVRDRIRSGKLPTEWLAARDEAQAVLDDVRVAGEVTDLADVPLALIESRRTQSTADFPASLHWYLPQDFDLEKAIGAMEQDTYAAHAQEVRLSSRGRLIPLDAGHYIQLTHPTVVADTVRQMVRQVRSP